MDKSIVFITGDLLRTEDRVRQMVHRTLAPLQSAVDMMAVKINHDNTPTLAAFGFHCTILLKTLGGPAIRAEARDCDDILAVYRALAKIVDQIQIESESSSL